MPIKSRIFIGGLLFFMLFLWMGCAGIPAKNSGRITPDRNVTAQFESHQISEDYNYYISGPDVYPNALMGLKKGYVLDSSLWKKIELTPDSLETTVTNMQDRARLVNRFQYGAAIYDNKGSQIGIWYSMLEAITAVMVQDNQTILIYTPDINTYKKYEKD